MSSLKLDELKEAREMTRLICVDMELMGNSVKEKFDLDGLKGKLTALPERIADTQLQVGNTKAKISDVESSMKNLEATVSYEIGMEDNGKGKPKFSNAEMRKAELIRRLEDDPAYPNLRANKIDLESQFFGFDIEVDKLRNDFKVALALKDLAVAELNLYSK